MSKSLPLIRAAAIMPMRRWCVENGHDWPLFLVQAGLDWLQEDDPAIPIPLLSAVALLQNMARQFGPDTPMRIVDRRAPVEIGLIGAAMAHEATLADGFRKVSKSMHAHCTHEFITVDERGGALHIGEGWTATFGNDEALHFAQQFTTAMIGQMCNIAGLGRSISSVAMVPHPEFGLTHLKPWLGDRLRPANGKMLDIEISLAAANQQISATERKRFDPVDPSMWPPLLGENTLSGAVIALLGGMIPNSRPNVERIVQASGMSKRTLQRRLGEEGTSFSELLEHALAQHALSRLSESAPPSISAIAKELGYSDQATLSRAVRRWSGQTPSQFAAKTGRASVDASTDRH